MKLKAALLLPFIFLLLSLPLFSQTIRVAHQKDYYPYSWSDSAGNPKGFLIEWWKLWATKVHVKVTFVSGSLDACLNMVLHDSADAMAGSFFEQDMKDHLRYAEFIMRLKTILFLEKGYNPKSVNEITKPVSIVKGELSDKFVRQKFPRLNLLYFNSEREMRSKIDQRVLSGFIYDYPDLRPPFEEVPAPKGYSKFLVIRADKIRPVVKEGNDRMIGLLMTGAAQITDNDILRIISGYSIIKKQSEIPWNGLIIASALFLMGLVALYLLLRSRRTNASPTGNDDEWKLLMEQGENERVEFKSSLRWDLRQEKVNKAMEHVIAKTISAFLNSEGGTLFIGVDDEGKAIGLMPDYMSLSRKNSDGFLLALTDVINRYIGKKTHRFINARIVNVYSREICIISMVRSDAPVFVGTGNEEEFFIRATASSQPLNMREAMEYIQSHWGRKA